MFDFAHLVGASRLRERKATWRFAALFQARPRPTDCRPQTWFPCGIGDDNLDHPHGLMIFEAILVELFSISSFMI